MIECVALRLTVAAIAAASIVARASPLVAIETTYGEDPVPNTQCYKGFINLGYGIDPIPAKTLSQRWHEWRTGRGIAPASEFSHRAGAASRGRTTAKQMGSPPSARRAYRASWPERR